MKRCGEKKNKHPKRIYPWGDDENMNLANYRDKGIGTSNGVGCFHGGISVYGCEKMSGNVWEWTRSLWKKEYPYVPGEEREFLDAGSDIARVLRGGSFFDSGNLARCAYRSYFHPDGRDGSVGFRVVVSPSSDL